MKNKKQTGFYLNNHNILNVFGDQSVLEEMDEDQRILGAQYLQEMREYDTKIIQLDFEKRSVRRRRQSLLEKERSLHRREKTLQIYSYNQENSNSLNMTSQSEHKEMAELQKKIDQIFAEIEYHHSILASLSNLKNPTKIPKKSEFIDRYREGSISTNFYQQSLQQQQKSLLKKREQFEERLNSARRMLAEPIDDCRLDEILISDIEEDAELVESQYNGMMQLFENENIDEIFEKLNECDSNNKKRKKELYAKKSAIQNEMKRYTLKKPVFQRQTSIEQKTQIISNISSSLKKDKVDKIINNICDALANRQKKLAAEEQEIDAIDAQNKQQRSEIERRWNIKVSRIKSLTEKTRLIEQSRIAISELLEKIDNEKHTFLAENDQKRKIKRRIKTILRDKDCNSQKNAEHRALVGKLTKRRDELEQNEAKIQFKRQKIEEEEKEIAAKEEDLQQYVNKVNRIEAQVSELQKLNDEKMSQIQESTAQFEATRIAFAAKIKEQNSDIFDSSIIESFTN